MGILANRLERWHRHLRKWAKRTGVTCYRVYERDIHEHPLIVDWYEGQVVVYAHPRGRDRTEEQREAWLDEVVEEVGRGLRVAADAIHLKERRRQRGLAQYEKLGDDRDLRVVNEWEQRFLVNLSDYLDTGLFLDHRNTRRRVRDEAAGKHVLNLFGYTGSFSVYAALGGAARVTTVDLSNTYLAWAEENFRINGLDPRRHHFVRADALKWLRDAVAERQAYHLIICDPPTFSNSKAMDRVLDIDRDHPEIINQCLRLLLPGGALYFSTNSRRFELRADDLSPCVGYETTPESIPEDFRNRQIHRCWRLAPATDDE